MAKVEDYLRTIVQENPNVNAFICTNKDAVARGLESEERIKSNNKKSDIDGMIISIKDNIHVKGMFNTAGTLALKDFIPAENAPLVEKLLSAGAVCIGKTNMEEMAMGITSYNPVFNQGMVVGVRNAHDHTKVAGGSSGGSAVSVAMDMCDISLGSDTGGSVRIPAALNGLVGYRPSTGRYSSEGVTPLSYTRDTIGILAKCVKDVQLVDGVVTEDETYSLQVEKKSKILLGYDATHCLANCSDEVLAAWEKALEKLKDDPRFDLVEVDTSSLQGLCNMSGNGDGSVIVSHECYHHLADYLKKYNTGISVEDLVNQVTTPTVKAIYTSALKDNREAYENAMNNSRPKLITEYQKLFTEVDILLSPTTPITAIDANPDHIWGPKGAEIFDLYTQKVDTTSVVGAPSITIPIANPGGLPVGLMIDGKIGNDLYVLSVAQDIEDLM